MPTPILVTNTIKSIKSNAPEILTGLGASGVVATAYLTGRASFKASGKLESSDPNESFQQKAKRVWKLYIPAGVSGAATIGCIIMANRGGHRRAAVAATAYSLTERAFSEYREKVVEQIGVNKEQKVRDEIVQEQVTKNPPHESTLVIVNGNKVLCRENYTGRYFQSDMETLRKAQNDVNAVALRESYVTMDEFYDLIGLDPTSDSRLLGWKFEKIMSLEFSSCLTPKGEPCLAFSYNYVVPV